MKKWQKKAIKEIMEEFDFGKVHITMEALGWTWGDSKKPPSIDELREEAESMLTRTVEGNNGYSDSGGFVVYHYTEEKYLRLVFLVESWEVGNYI